MFSFYKLLTRAVFIFGTCLTVWFFAAAPAAATDSQLFGIHILHPEEMHEAATLLKNDYNRREWNFVTLPLPMSDLTPEGHSRWQNAFNEAHRYRLAPIVRLVSDFDQEKNAWKVPTRADIMAIFDFLSALTWPTEKKFVIIYNEPNHASEWGGQIDPAGYTAVLRFAAAWAHSENLDYWVLPAAMDLAAPNGKSTMEAFNYLERMLAVDQSIFSIIDYWNSHSYPNPAFSAPASATGKNTLRGFQHELDWLKNKTGLERRAFITETGWEMNSKTTRKLEEYYRYAVKNIWNDERLVAITPFVLRGDPGPFAKFTLLDKVGEPTANYEAIQNVCYDHSEINAFAVAGF